MLYVFRFRTTKKSALKVGGDLLWQVSKRMEVHLRSSYERRQRKLRLLSLSKKVPSARLGLAFEHTSEMEVHLHFRVREESDYCRVRNVQENKE